MQSFVKIKNPFKPVEERPTPRCVYNWRIYLTAFLSTTSSMLIGYDTGFIGGMTQNQVFLDKFNIDYEAESGKTIVSNIISCFHMAAFGGALFSYPIQFYWGNCAAMLFASASGVIGSAIMLGCINGSLAPLYVGRVISGLCVGAATNVTIVYLSEVSPAPIRGQIVAIFEVGWRIGDLVGFWINYGVEKGQPAGPDWYVIPIAVQLIPAGMFFLGSFILKESPRWLAQHGHYDKALKNLCWLRKLNPGDDYLDWEFSSMKEGILEQQAEVGTHILDPARKIWNSKKLLKRLMISAWLLVLPNFMGIQSINYYSVTLFKQIGFEGDEASMYGTGFLGVMKFGCTAIYIAFIVDSSGRRPAFLISSFFCAIWFWYIGAYLKVTEDDPSKSGGAAGQMAVGSMYLWVASFLLAWSGGPFVWAAEVFEQNLRQFTQPINADMSWIPIFIMAKATASMASTMRYGMFFFFACIDLTAIPFVYFFVPETKGIPLEKIDMLFQDGLSAWSAHSVTMRRLKEEQEAEKENNAYGVKDNKDKDKPEVEFVEYVDQ